MEYIPKEIIKDHILPYFESNAKQASQSILVETLCYPNSVSVEIELKIIETILYKDKCNSFTSIVLSFDIEESEITFLKKRWDNDEMIPFNDFLIHEKALLVKQNGLRGFYFDWFPKTIIEIINIAMDNMGNLDVAKEKISNIPEVILGENLRS